MEIPCMFDEALIKEKLNLDLLLEKLQVAFFGLFDGTSVQPPEVVTELPGQAGDCIFYSGLVSELGAFGVAVSPYLVARQDRGLSPVTSYTMLISTDTGLPLIICDSKYLTTVRTAATTMLACRLLTNGRQRSLAVVGAGSLGLEHARQAALLNMFNDITVVSPSVMNAKAKLHDMRIAEISKLGGNVQPGSSVEAVVREADVVMLCTDSATAVVENEWLGNAQLVTSISTNAPGAHEVSPDLLLSSRVYCDYRETCPSTAGEMIKAVEYHGWSVDKIEADLPELIAEKQVVNSAEGRLKYFRSVGLGIEDIAAASAILSVE